MKKIILMNLIALLLTGNMAAQEYSQENPQETNENTASACDFDPISQGCRVFGFGPVIAAGGDGDIAYGLSGYYGYFIFRKVSLTLGASSAFSSGYNYLAAGPDLTYYITKIGAILISAGYSVKYVSVWGNVSGKGSLHGPVISGLLPLSGRVFMGISGMYQMSEFEGNQRKEWTYSPAIAMFF